MRILIAEDDAISRSILARAVAKLGHDCLVATDGAEAWELYQRSEVDVVISDMMMPGVDGVELCRRVRAGAAAYTYFIFLTALADKEHFLEGMQAGADDYLAKPLDLFELGVRLVAASRVTSLHRQLLDQRAQLEQLNAQLFQQARRDALTQLPNRLQLREDLEALCARVQRYGHSYCAALYDIDHFKQYNDTYGHLAGDEVLRTVAGALAQGFRRGDIVYRYGGEEFLVILPEQSLNLAALAVERVCRSVELMALPHRGKTPPGLVTVSAGVSAITPGEDKTAEALLKEADTALYRAKQTGRNRVVVYASADEPAAGPGREMPLLTLDSLK